MKYHYLGSALAAVAAIGMGAAAPANAGHPDISVQLSWGLPAYHASHYGYAPPLVVYPAPVYQPYYGDHRYGHPGYRSYGRGHYHGKRICHVQNHFRGDDEDRRGHGHGYDDD